MPKNVAMNYGENTIAAAMAAEAQNFLDGFEAYQQGAAGTGKMRQALARMTMYYNYSKNNFKTPGVQNVFPRGKGDKGNYTFDQRALDQQASWVAESKDFCDVFDQYSPAELNTLKGKLFDEDGNFRDPATLTFSMEKGKLEIGTQKAPQRDQAGERENTQQRSFETTYQENMVGYALNQAANTVLNSIDQMKQDPEGYGEAWEIGNQEARLAFARMIKYYDYSQKAFRNPGPANFFRNEGEKAKLDLEAEELANSPAVINLFNGNLDKVQNVLCDKYGVIRDPDDIVLTMAAEQKVQFGTKEEVEQAQRHSAKLMTGFLKQTTSKSFAGKLKSWFVGNSKEYKNATEALEKFSNGDPDVKKGDVIRAITNYLDIRKGKVRDHQYGRDRFNGMMECLGTLMEPDKFKEYCDSVNTARKAIDPNNKAHIKPEKYAEKEGSILDGLRREEKAQLERDKQRQAEYREKLARDTEKAEKEFDAPTRGGGEMKL